MTTKKETRELAQRTFHFYNIAANGLYRLKDKYCNRVGNIELSLEQVNGPHNLCLEVLADVARPLRVGDEILFEQTQRFFPASFPGTF